jgi:hypothetical protein
MNRNNVRQTSRRSPQDTTRYVQRFRARVVNALSEANSSYATWVTPADVREKIKQRAQKR